MERKTGRAGNADQNRKYSDELKEMDRLAEAQD